MKLRERKLREWICPSIHPLQLERECPIPWKILHKNLFSFGKNEDGDETKQTKKKKEMKQTETYKYLEQIKDQKT